MSDLNWTALLVFLFCLSAIFTFGDVLARSPIHMGDDRPTRWTYIFRASVIIFGSVAALTWGV